jgi:hypothetical protein
MTAPRNPGSRDPDNLIRAFLAEGQDELPVPVYDEVRGEIDHTGQRTFFAPWRDSSVIRFAPAAAVAAVIVLAIIVGLQLGNGPLIGSSPSDSASPTESAEPSPSAEPTAPASEAPSVTPSPVPMPANPEFTCELGIQSEYEDGHAHLTDIDVTSLDGFDRVTFTYDGDSIPGYTIESAHAPFTHDPSGLPMEVAGTSVYQIAIHGGTKYTDDYTSTYYGPINFEPGYEQIVQLVESGDFEATNVWYLGLNGGECLRAFYVTDPTRIIVDVQH